MFNSLYPNFFRNIQPYSKLKKTIRVFIIPFDGGQNKIFIFFDLIDLIQKEFFGFFVGARRRIKIVRVCFRKIQILIINKMKI